MMNQSKDLAFSARLRIFRSRGKLSQVDLSKQLGVSGNYLSMLELGKKTPSIRIVKLFESFEQAGRSAAVVDSAGSLAGTNTSAEPGNALYSLLSTPTLVLNLAEMAQKLPLLDPARQKVAVRALRDLLAEIEQRLSIDSDVLADPAPDVSRLDRSGESPGAK